MNVDSYTGLRSRISQEQDDLLATIQLVHDNDRLSRHLFEALVDRLLAALFLDLRQRHATGQISDAEMAHEMMELTEQCHSAGLAPPH